MQAITVLAGVYDAKVFRACIHPEVESEDALHDFPEAWHLESAPRFERISAHRDAQGMIQCKKRGLKFFYDPPTGNFNLLDGRGAIVSGMLQTGKFGDALFQVRLEPEDHVYGFGAATGKENRNEQSFRLMNLDTIFGTIPKRNYSSFPFFLIRRSSGAFVGLFLNTTLPCDVRIDSRDVVDGEMTGASGGAGVRLRPDTGGPACTMDFFVFYGSLPEILRHHADLTGRPYLPPVWALGYHQSRWSYKTEERVMQLARRFRETGVPCDAIHLDIHYMDRYMVFTWDARRFPNPTGMHRRLEDMGLRTVVFNDPGVSTREYDVYRDGLAKDVYCKRSDGNIYVGKVWPGASVFPDFSREDVRDWWAARHAPILGAGVSGVCNDMNDPVLRIGKNYDGAAEDLVHAAGSHREVRNLYANYEAEATHRAFAEHRPGERPFVLTRSAFTGIQKYSALWTGDNHSTWEHLRENLHQVLNLGLSGVPFTGADVGGFSSGFMPGTLKVLKIRKQKELFARWMELGSLMPFFRAHTALMSFDQEPWSFGDEVLDIARKHIRRRYHLLPYIYGLFCESHRSGDPIVRPLFYDFPEVSPGDCHDQFMLGPALLAAPVTERRAKRRKVFLPAGCDWYEYETGRRYGGGETFTFQTRPGYYPLFVRAGTILPVCPVRDNAETSMHAGLALEIYPAKSMAGNLCLDDGTTTAAIEKKQYFEQQYAAEQDRNGDIRLTIETSHKKWTPPYGDLEIRLPAGYGSMKVSEKGKDKFFEATAADLTQDDRIAAMNSFRLPLTSTEAEFKFQGNRPG